MSQYIATSDERSALQIQMSVIGALLIRELHTRFGRHNVGYLWLLLEPMLLTVAVTGMHAFSGSNVVGSYDLAPFWATGYTPFIMWRGIVSKSEAALESNKTLLHHRHVTLLNILIARAILEFLAVAASLFIILGLCTAMGLGNLPDRPLYMFAGLLLLFWFSFSIGLLVAAGCSKSPVLERLVHPLIYLSLPISGAFYSMSWLPSYGQQIMGWVPLTHMFEMIRMGQFAEYPSRFVNPLYVIAWCMPLTLLGLVSLRLVRRTMHLT